MNLPRPRADVPPAPRDGLGDGGAGSSHDSGRAALMTDAFVWESLWPEGTRSREWSHSGIAVTREGVVVFCAPEGRTLVLLDVDSGRATRRDTSLLEVHGISLDVTEREGLWLSDPGAKPRAGTGYQVESKPGRVLRIALDSPETQELYQPDLPEYSEGCWRPTSTVADNDGGVWVADGYGASLVHKFDRDGRHLLTLGGSAAPGGLSCPHGLAIDTRGGDELLVVADRGNRRLLSFTLDGRLHGMNSSSLFTTPSSLAIRGDELIVTELNGGLLAVSPAGDVRPLVLPLAAPVRDYPWPNALVGGELQRPTLSAGTLHSPHGLAVGPDGSIYVTEWLIGGRQLRLRPRTGQPRSGRKKDEGSGQC